MDAQGRGRASPVAYPFDEYSLSASQSGPGIAGSPLYNLLDEINLDPHSFSPEYTGYLPHGSRSLTTSQTQIIDDHATGNGISRDSPTRSSSGVNYGTFAEGHNDSTVPNPSDFDSPLGYNSTRAPNTHHSSSIVSPLASLSLATLPHEQSEPETQADHPNSSPRTLTQ
ncbi:hypothetical protein K474DRAFT_1706508 [Panus rudis PR-1116 ss-1]|nr:hypothetical protein K474DRAFT_1706508 [Panus rudis PR-1116 ss-1]